MYLGNVDLHKAISEHKIHAVQRNILVLTVIKLPSLPASLASYKINEGYCNHWVQKKPTATNFFLIHGQVNIFRWIKATSMHRFSANLHLSI